VQPASSILEYRIEGTKSWSKPIIKTDAVTQHVITLTGLKPATRYRYRVGSNGRLLRDAVFQTDKLAGQPFSVAVWGDSGVGNAAQKKLAAQLEKNNPDLLVHTGDLIYPRGAYRHFDPYFFSVYQSTLKRVPFYGSLGNHDVITKNGRPFLDNFVLPRNGPAGVEAERNYAYQYADALWVVIDSNHRSSTLRDKVVPWLEQTAKRSRAIWKFAVFHHPPFSSGLHGDEMKTKEILVPALTRAKFDVVFNGHDHAYERFKPQNGVTYIVTGAGGAERYPRRKTRDITAFFDNKNVSFTRLDINKRTLRGRQITAEGRVLEEWRLQK
jgi:predicted phosphodiesterase